MGRTYIRIGCPKCNYSYSTSAYGYVEDPIGVPLTQCPRCNNISRDNKHKEWIQMSPIKKYFSISPRGNILSIFLAIIPVMILVRNNIEIGDMIFGIFAASWIIADYIVISIRVNCQNCLERIISSISRTNDESYAQLLSQFGKYMEIQFQRYCFYQNQIEHRLRMQLKPEKPKIL